MLVSGELFHLIKSLKQAEKRYFKVFAGRHVVRGKNNYVRLFEAIEKQDRYDENAILSRFRGERFIRHLSSVKPYLYRLILKCLHEFHGGAGAQIREMLHYEEILYEKGLHGQSRKVLSRAKTLAYGLERHELLLEITTQERKYTRRDRESFSGFTAERQRLFGLAEQDNAYQNLADEVYSLFETEGEIRSRREKKIYLLALNNPLLKSELHAATFEGRLCYHEILGLLHRVLGHPDKSYHHRKKFVELMESGPELLATAEGVNRYAIALNNLSIPAATLGKQDEVRKIMDKLFRLNYPSLQLKAFIYSLSCANLLGMYGYNGRFREGIEHFKKLETELLRMIPHCSEPNKVTLFSNIFYNYFGIGDYEKALFWLNRLLNETRKDVREDTQCLARIVNLVLHYELGHEDLLEYLVKPTYRFLYKRNRLYKFENIMLDFIRRRLTGSMNRKELILAFTGLKKELVRITRDPFERKILESFDFIAWLESKISGMPFAETVRKKATQHLDTKPGQ